MARPKVIVNLYPVLPARDEADRACQQRNFGKTWQRFGKEAWPAGEGN